MPNARRPCGLWRLESPRYRTQNIFKADGRRAALLSASSGIRAAFLVQGHIAAGLLEYIQDYAVVSRFVSQYNYSRLMLTEKNMRGWLIKNGPEREVMLRYSTVAFPQKQHTVAISVSPHQVAGPGTTVAQYHTSYTGTVLSSHVARPPVHSTTVLPYSTYCKPSFPSAKPDCSRALRTHGRSGRRRGPLR